MTCFDLLFLSRMHVYSWLYPEQKEKEAKLPSPLVSNVFADLRE